MIYIEKQFIIKEMSEECEEPESPMYTEVKNITFGLDKFLIKLEASKESEPEITPDTNSLKKDKNIVSKVVEMQILSPEVMSKYANGI
jgi:hypothetical protein